MIVETLTPGARRILDTASDLFYENGISAVGVDLIAERSGVTKRTLYDRFGSKDVLVATYLRERDARWRRTVEAALAEPGLSPAERVLVPFAVLGEWTRRNRRGCALVNALAELPDPDHPAHGAAAAEKRWLLDLFARTAATAGVTDAEGLARRLLCLHEGALAMSAVLPGSDCVDAAESAARDLVQQA